MEQSPSWEANEFSASQEVPCILWNLKVHYRNHKYPPPVPILCQLDPIHTPTSYFLKIHLNIILPSMPGSPKWPLSLRFPYQNPEYASPIPHMCYMPCPSHSIIKLIFFKHEAINCVIPSTSEVTDMPQPISSFVAQYTWNHQVACAETVPCNMYCST